LGLKRFFIHFLFANLFLIVDYDIKAQFLVMFETVFQHIFNPN